MHRSPSRRVSISRLSRHGSSETFLGDERHSTTIGPIPTTVNNPTNSNLSISITTTVRPNVTPSGSNGIRSVDTIAHSVTASGTIPSGNFCPGRETAKNAEGTGEQVKSGPRPVAKPPVSTFEDFERLEQEGQDQERHSTVGHCAKESNSGGNTGGIQPQSNQNKFVETDYVPAEGGVLRAPPKPVTDNLPIPSELNGDATVEDEFTEELALPAEAWPRLPDVLESAPKQEGLAPPDISSSMGSISLRNSVYASTRPSQSRIAESIETLDSRKSVGNPIHAPTTDIASQFDASQSLKFDQSMTQSIAGTRRPHVRPSQKAKISPAIEESGGILRPEDVENRLTGIIPSGLRELEMLGEHVSKLSEVLRLAQDPMELDLVSDEYGENSKSTSLFPTTNLESSFSGGLRANLSRQNLKHSKSLLTLSRDDFLSAISERVAHEKLNRLGNEDEDPFHTKRWSRVNNNKSRFAGVGYQIGRTSVLNGGDRSSITANPGRGGPQKVTAYMIENADYTPITETQAPMLPNGILPVTHLTTAVRNRKRITEQTKRKWCTHVANRSCQFVLVYGFWYILLKRFKEPLAKTDALRGVDHYFPPQTIHRYSTRGGRPHMTEESHKSSKPLLHEAKNISDSTNQLSISSTEETLHHLSSRLSHHYAQFFLSTSSRSFNKDLFFDSFPDILAQSLYTAFRDCFSHSVQVFDGTFQRYLCEMTVEMTSGLQPLHPFCERWKSSIEVVSRGKVNGNRVDEEEGEDGEDGVETSKKDGSRDMLTKQSTKKSLKASQKVDLSSWHNSLNNKAKSVSSRPGPLVITRKNVFDTTRNSPLIQTYISSMGIPRPPGTNKSAVVERTEVVKIIGIETNSATENNSTPTYQELIKQSVETSESLFSSFKDIMKIKRRERNRTLLLMQQQMELEERKVTRILSNPKQVKLLADEILESYGPQAYHTSWTSSRRGYRTVKSQQTKSGQSQGKSTVAVAE